MISRNLFCKLMKEDLKQRLWSVILAAIVFLIIPVTMALQLEDNYYADNAVFLRRVASVVTNSPWLVIITCVGAVLCGLSGFWYLFSKKKVDFFHALPVKREVMFAVRYINGILIYVVPYLAALAISLIMAAANDAFPPGLFGDAFAWFGFYLCSYLVFYTVTIIGVMLTGNLVISMAATAILFFYSLAAYGLALGFGDVFFETFCTPDDFFGGRFAFLKWTSPFYLYINFFDEPSVGTNGLKMLAIAVVLLVIAVLLYKKRAVEYAGAAIAFPKIKALVRILIVIPCGLAMGLFLYLVSAQNSVVWLIFGGAFGVVFVHGLLESIYEYDIRKALGHKWQLLACLLVTYFITFSCQQDWFNYDQYLPKQAKVERIGVAIQSLNYRNMYWSEEGNDEEVAVLYKLAEYCVNGNMEEESNYYYYEDTIQTTEMRAQQIRNVKITYKLKNGNEVSRQYRIDLLAEEPFWDDLYAKTGFASAQFANILNMHPLELEYIQTTTEDIGKEYTLSNAEKQELLNALSRDLLALQYRTMREQLPVGELHLETQSYNYYEIELYPTYTETLAFLEAHGFQPNAKIPLDQVRNLTIYDYRSMEERNVYLNLQAESSASYTTSEGVIVTPIEKAGEAGNSVITDKELIEKIYPYLIWNGYTTLYSNTMEAVECVIMLDLDEYGNYERISYQFKEDTPIDALLKEAIEKGAVAE